MTETTKLDPSAGEPGIGHNEPPPDPFVARLEETNTDVTNSAANLELESFDLPEKVESDDDVAKITAWVVRARDQAREIEKRRTDANREPLDMQRKINNFFGRLKDNITSRAKAMEARSESYLVAKKARQEAEAREAAQRAAAEQRAKEAEAREAREAQQRAEREAAEAKAKLEAAKNAEQRAAAEAELRKAGEAITENAQAAQDAEKEAAKHEKAAEKNLSVAEGGHALNKTGAGGNVKVKTVTEAKIVSTQEIMKSLGPLGPYLAWAHVEAAIGRAAKEQKETRLEIPGVTWVEKPVVQTTATKK